MKRSTGPEGLPIKHTLVINGSPEDLEEIRFHAMKVAQTQWHTRPEQGLALVVVALVDEVIRLRSTNG